MPGVDNVSPDEGIIKEILYFIKRDLELYPMRLSIFGLQVTFKDFRISNASFQIIQSFVPSEAELIL